MRAKEQAIQWQHDEEAADDDEARADKPQTWRLWSWAGVACRGRPVLGEHRARAAEDRGRQSWPVWPQNPVDPAGSTNPDEGDPHAREEAQCMAHRGDDASQIARPRSP